MYLYHDTTMEKRQQQIQKQINTIKSELVSLGHLHPGSLSMQKRARGRDYPHLSYSHNGKGHTQYVRKADLPVLREELNNYKRMHELVSRWVGLEIELSRMRRSRGRKSRRKPKETS